MSDHNQPFEGVPQGESSTQEKQPKVVFLPIASLVRDEGFNARADGNQPEHVERLLESDPDDWPPILVTQQEDGSNLVLDGNHRLAAAELLGLTSLRCRVIEDGGYPEAFEENRRHGLPLSTSDRKEYAVWLRENEPELSLREIGRRCGLHHGTVKAAIEESEEEDDEGYDDDEAEAEATAAAPAAATAPLKPAIADRLVSLVLRATDAGEGVGMFNRNKRAAVIRKVIKEYDIDSRAEVAEALDAWGAAMQTAAEPFLGGD